MLDMSTDTHAVGVLEGEVRELVRRRGVDPARDRAAVDQLVRDVVADYETRSALGAVAPLADPAAAGRAVVDAVAGLGPLQPYLDDPEIEEIWINALSAATTQVKAPAEPPSPRGVRTRISPTQDAWALADTRYPHGPETTRRAQEFTVG